MRMTATVSGVEAAAKSLAVRNVKFGMAVAPDALLKLGISLDIVQETPVRIGNIYEGPCEIKTTIRDILEFGAFSYINGRGRFSNIRIGRYCSIAETVSVGYPEHPTGWLGTSSLQYMKPGWMSEYPAWKTQPHQPTKITTIGHDVWIGAGAFIRSGIAIGHGSVIGAHAVVTKDVAPYSIVVGNPGRVIRTRVPKDMIASLLASKWWEFAPWQLDGCPFENPKKAVQFVADLRKSGAKPYVGSKLVITPTGARLECEPGRA